MSAPDSVIQQLGAAVAAAETILILQPDSPDGDSLGSALGLEEIFGDLGKQVKMYSYKAAEPYLHGLEGHDRVSQDLPKQFDLIVLVDTGSPSLIKSALEHHFAALTSKPFFIIDHHTSRQNFGFNTTEIVEEAVATSELITRICLELDWPINPSAADKLASALLSDSLGLTTSGTTTKSVEALAELTRRGANLYELYKTKREAGALTTDLLHLKGKLLASVEFYEDGKLAMAEITPDMVARYKDIAEPYTLILNEMQWTKGVELVAVFKNYGDKINVPLRSTTGVAADVAEKFGGGGHPNAAAYRCKTPQIRAEIDLLARTFHDYLKENPSEALQHP
ncbi:MAG: bifunctional oligoribonuclease/PAP phosphatase NrnA [Candidatus Saccharimonadales bacterium]